MSVQPLVSVIIPAYNAAGTIERALQSVFSQSYAALEIIVVDDGSADDTPALLRRLSASRPGLTVLTQPNAGVSAARNRALSACSGKYIRFVDADDTLPPDSIAHMVLRAEQDRSELVIGGYTEYMNRLSRSKNLMNLESTILFQDLLPSLCLHANSYFFGVLWNKLFSADLVRSLSLRFDPALWWGEDFAFVMDYLHEVRLVSFMQEDVYDYRRTPRSASIRQVADSLVHPLANIRVKLELYGHLKSLYRDRGVYDQYKSRLWHYLFRVGLS